MTTTDNQPKNNNETTFQHKIGEFVLFLLGGYAFAAAIVFGVSTGWRLSNIIFGI